MNLLVCDIDGTLVAESQNPFEPDANLPPNLAMTNLLKAVSQSDDWYVALVTSRSTDWQQATLKWLAKHCDIEAALCMREKDDWGIAPDYKLIQLNKLLLIHSPTLLLAIDSRTDICTAYREKGYTVLEPFK